MNRYNADVERRKETIMLHARISNEEIDRRGQATGLEAELLRVLRRRRPRAFNCRYRELMGKRSEETLTEIEYEELLRMTDEAEAFDTRRIKALSELAKLRQTTPDTLLQELGMARQCIS